MPMFRLLIEGQNFPGFLFDKADVLYGFYTTRWVEADEVREAELAALRSVKWEFKDLLPEPEPGNPEPSLHLVETQEVNDIPVDSRSSGATWFPMDSE